MTTHCIYHDQCVDGLTAGWIVSRALAMKGVEVEMHAGRYGEPPPEIGERDTVYIVDFSYPTNQLDDLCERADVVFLWDHHQTSLEAVSAWGDGQPKNLSTILVKHQSGAQIAWAMLHDRFPFDTQISPIIDRVGDRDLWNFKLSGTARLFAAMSSRPYTLEAWDEIMETPLVDLFAEGAAIDRYRTKLIDSALERVQFARIYTRDDVAVVPVVNCGYEIGSDVAGRLLDEYPAAPFAGYYLDEPTRRKWGLRSADDRMDVALVAERYGGGGHRNASGFTAADDLILLSCHDAVL